MHTSEMCLTRACTCALTLGQALSMLKASDTSEAADSASASIGSDAPSAVVGDDALSAVVGDDAPSAVVGDDAPSAVVGSDAPSAVVGDDAPSAVVGDDAPSTAIGADSSAEEKTSVTASEPIASAGRSSCRTCCFDWCIHTRPVIHSCFHSKGNITEDQCVPTIQKNRTRRVQHENAVQSGPQIRPRRHRVGLRRAEGRTLTLRVYFTCIVCKFLVFMPMMASYFTMMKSTTW